MGVACLGVQFWRTDTIRCYIITDADLDNYEVDLLARDEIDRIEADSFWCFSKLLDGIQDNYTFAQPGIQLKVSALKDIIKRVDSEYICIYYNIFIRIRKKVENNAHCLKNLQLVGTDYFSS